MTVCEWLIVIAAYAYEILDRPIMSDMEYDLRTRALDKWMTDIPGFSPATGYWVRDLDLDLIDRVYQKAASYYPAKKDLHSPQIQHALNELEIQFTCCNSDVCNS